MAALIIMIAAGCGGGDGGSDDSDSFNNGEDVVPGVPGWIKGPWAMVRWGGEDVTRFSPIFTIADSTFSSAFNDIGSECKSYGSLVMNANAPSWQSNEYSMSVSDSTCASSWGPASLEGDYDQGAMFAENERFLIRVSYLFPDFWEYKRE